MASIEQLNSFIGKFVSLWKTGQNVTLKLEAVAGKANVALELGLDEEASPVQGLLVSEEGPHFKLCENVSLANNVGLSRLRRRERRAFARKIAAEKASAVNDTAEDADSNVGKEVFTQTAEEAVEVKTEEIV